MTNQLLTITELNYILDQVIGSDPLLSDLSIQAEVTSIKSYPNIHYLTLSDSTSYMSAIMFKGTPPKLGDHIMARGKPTFFTKKGTLQFQINYFKKLDKGLLSQELEALKLKLEKEGLFSLDRKKPIPQYPTHIALITANKSAALADFITLKSTLIPHLKLSLIPTTVQGASAINSIQSAINYTNTLSEIDIVVVFRGGGSADDLSWFNHESIVRTIANASHPIMTAIGHEIDYTLADFAADFRAATPSSAIHTIAAPFIEAKKHILNQLQAAQYRVNHLITDRQETTVKTLNHAIRQVNQTLTKTKENVYYLTKLADSVNPLRKLSQGFSISALKETKKTIRSIQDVKPNDIMITRTCDGLIESTVTNSCN